MRTISMCAALAALVVAFTAAARAADDDSVLAAKTRKLLKTKISVDFKDTRMEDVKNELMEEVKGLKIMLDAKGGVSRNSTLTYKAADKTVEQILDEMLTKPDLGYIVISKKGNAYDGVVQIRKSKERGYEKK